MYAVTLGKYFEYGVIAFQPIREVTWPKTCFWKGCGCPDDNLKSASPIDMKFGKWVHYVDVWNHKLLEVIQYKMADSLTIN